MAFEIRDVKKKARGKDIIFQYPLMNKKIVDDVTSTGLLDRDTIKEVLDTFFEYGNKSLEAGEIFKIPYVGSFKPKDYKLSVEEYYAKIQEKKRLREQRDSLIKAEHKQEDNATTTTW